MVQELCAFFAIKQIFWFSMTEAPGGGFLTPSCTTHKYSIGNTSQNILAELTSNENLVISAVKHQMGSPSGRPACKIVCDTPYAASRRPSGPLGLCQLLWGSMVMRIIPKSKRFGLRLASHERQVMDTSRANSAPCSFHWTHLNSPDMVSESTCVQRINAPSAMAVTRSRFPCGGSLSGRRHSNDIAPSVSKFLRG
jgi:hypothetical protein